MKYVKRIFIKKLKVCSAKLKDLVIQGICIAYRYRIYIYLFLFILGYLHGSSI